MTENSETEPGRVIGIGGVFFKSANRDTLNSWYAQNLGLQTGSDGFAFKWRAHDRPEVERGTVWSLFPSESTYFEPSQAPFMMNYIVDDMDAILAKLAKTGAAIDPKREDCDFGRFAWISDPDGNKIELWEPRGT
jgi:catechol 2,3-dioxygenase-like lactoylglutathione lyase family enzyme